MSFTSSSLTTSVVGGSLTARDRKTAIEQKPPSELLFSNQTGAVVQCGVALELAQNIAKAERQMTAKLQQAQQSAINRNNNRHYQQQAAAGAQLILLQRYAIKIRWEKTDQQLAHGDTELEQAVYGSGGSGNQARGPLLRFVRQSDQALVFEPFRAIDFRPDVHSATYRCVATSSTMGASVISRDMRVKAVVASLSMAPAMTWNPAPPFQSANQPSSSIEVLDELVVEGNSAMFKCQIPSSGQDYLQVLDWIEYPSEQTLTYQGTTLASANLLFRPPNLQASSNLSSANSSNPNSQLVSNHQMKYFVAPKSGDLHILNVYSNFNYRSYKCRCKDKLTGEVISSTNKGKLIVSESHSPLAPRLILDTPSQIVHDEGQLALLNCNTQSFSRWSRFTWSKKQPNGDSQQLLPLAGQSDKYAQLANLLLINQANRNDSGIYICHVKNSVGEEQLELELVVRAQLKASLTSSARVLELGKSLSLECIIRGYPIHQVVFRHNQNIIKSISGQAVNSQLRHHHHLHPHHRHQNHDHELANQSGRWRVNERAKELAGGYFVVDGGESSASSSATSAGSFGPQESSGQSADQEDGHYNDHESAADEDDEQADWNGGEARSSQEIELLNEAKLSHVVVIVLEPQHAGAYQCFAFNQYESIQSSTYIRVLDDPPKFKDTFKGEVYEPGQDISLQCSARANPLPEITWSIDDQPMPESTRTRFGDFVTKDNLVISYVNISNTQVIDSGLYRCMADNGLAQVSHQAQISVSGPLQIKAMPNQTVVASESLRIRCPVAGYPIQEIQWQKGGRRLPANHRQRVYDNGTLEVEHMEKSQGDEGEYTCLALSPSSTSKQSNNAGDVLAAAQSSIQVNIRVRPTIEPFSVSRSLREGQRASITCTISSGDLPISISWFHNGQPLVLDFVDSQNHYNRPDLNAIQPPQVLSSSPSGSNFDATSASASAALSAAQQESTIGEKGSTRLAGVRISRVSDYSSSLLFESLLAEHSGNYTCSARNDAGSVSHQTPMVVQVAPKWSIEPTDTSIVRGFSRSIDCVANGFPPPRIIWTKASSDPTGSSASSSSFPVTIGSSSNNNISPGQLIQAQPLTKSHHLGSWKSIVSSPHLQVFENGSLNILDAKDSDVGHYMCQANNGVGPGLSKVIKVTINVAAQFNLRHSVQYASKGESVNLKCQAKGDWPLVVHWFKNKYRLEPINLQDDPSAGAQAPTDESQQRAFIISATKAALLLPSSSPISSSSLAQLQKPRGSVLEQLNALLSSQATQRGSLEGSSGVGQQPGNGLVLQRYSLATSELSGSEDVEGLRARFDHSAASYQQNKQPLVIQVKSALSISQLERQDTGTFKCLAANHFGFDERTIQLIVQEVPDRIDELSVLEVNSRSIILGWLAPYDGNSPIIKYHVQYRPLMDSASDPFGASNKQTSSSAMMVSQEALDTLSWLNYTIAASSVGDQAGGKLNNVTVNPVHNSRQHPDLITDADPDWPPASPMDPQSGLSQGSSRTLVKVIVNNLRPMTHYWFRLQAENKLGYGRMSHHVESRTIEEAPASVPTKLKAVAQSSSSVLVSWHRLSDKEISTGPIHGYYVAYRQLNDTSKHQKDTSGSEQNTDDDDNNRTLPAKSGESSPVVTNIYKTVQHSDKLSKFDALLTNLKRSTKYVISVQAFNGRGTGPATEPVVVQTLEMDKPKQVKLYVKSSSNCSIQLEWRPMSQVALMQRFQGANKPTGSQTPTYYGAQRSSPLANKQQSNGSPNDLPGAMPLLVDAANDVVADESSGGSQSRTNNINVPEADVVDYYSLYQAELNDRPQWQETRLAGHLTNYQVDNLRCGTRYQFYMIGVNKIGVGDQSDILDTKTDGGLPLAPDRQSTFDVINTTCYIIRLDHWQDNGCPIREFNIRFRYENARQWTHLAHFDLTAGASLAPSSEGEGGLAELQVTKRKDNDLRQLSGSQLPAAATTAPTSASASAPVSVSGPISSLVSGSTGRRVSRAPRRLIDETNDDVIVDDDDDDDDEDLDLRQRQLSLGRPSDPQQPGKGSPASNSDTYVYSSMSFSPTSSLSSGPGNGVSGDTGGDSAGIVEGDSFLDYSSSSSAVDSQVTPAAGGNSDYSAHSSTSSSSSSQRRHRSARDTLATSNLSNSVQQQENSQLVSLLKDSMIQAFVEPSSNDLEEFQASSFSQSPSAATVSKRSTFRELTAEPNSRDKWQAMNLVSSEGVSQDKGNYNTSTVAVGSHMSRSSKSLDQLAIDSATSSNRQNDWKRVRFCNLVDNVYYSIQILASNSVGETEAELKILTSQEGLEYDQDIKRRVVGRLGSDRLAYQSPIFVPLTLTLMLVAILLIVSIILRRSNHCSSSSTSTTTTMSSSNNDCQSYLSEHRQQQQQHNHNTSFKGVSSGQSAITEAAIMDGSDIILEAGVSCPNDGGNYAAIVRPSKLPIGLDGYVNGLVKHQESTFDEPPYGMASQTYYQHHHHHHHQHQHQQQPHLAPLGQASSTNDSALGSSPTTTLITNSTGSSAPQAATGIYSRPAILQQQLDQQQANGSAANIRGGSGTLARNAVYLCSNRASLADEQSTKGCLAMNNANIKTSSSSLAAIAHYNLQQMSPNQSSSQLDSLDHQLNDHYAYQTQHQHQHQYHHHNQPGPDAANEPSYSNQDDSQFQLSNYQHHHQQQATYEPVHHQSRQVRAQVGPHDARQLQSCTNDTNNLAALNLLLPNGKFINAFYS